MQCHVCICFPSNYAVRHPIDWYNLFHYKHSNSHFFVWICYFLIHAIPQCNAMSVCPPCTSNNCYRVFHSVIYIYIYMDRNIKQRNLNITMWCSTPMHILSLPASVSWPEKRFSFFWITNRTGRLYSQIIFIGTFGKLSARHKFQYLAINYIKYNLTFQYYLNKSVTSKAIFLQWRNNS
jgi:hypothetical protein